MLERDVGQPVAVAGDAGAVALEQPPDVDRAVDSPAVGGGQEPHPPGPDGDELRAPVAQPRVVEESEVRGSPGVVLDDEAGLGGRLVEGVEGPPVLTAHQQAVGDVRRRLRLGVAPQLVGALGVEQADVHPARS